VTIRQTLRFVRRQRRWFRRDPRIRWVDGASPDLRSTVAEALAHTL
jgi:tRNA dimethylallyltransferase